MATENILDPIISNFDYLINEIRQEILSHFRELLESLKTRESELLQKLQEISHRYKQHENEKESMLKEFEGLQRYLEGDVSSSILGTIKQEVKSKLQESLKTLQLQIDSFKVSFTWDNDTAQRVKCIGNLQEGPQIEPSDDTSVIKRSYKQKLTPYLCAGTLSSSSGLAIDNKTLNMYVVESTWNTIHVFSNEGKFMFKFGNVAMFFGKMSHPKGICIFEDRLYISQRNNHLISLHQLDGTFIQYFGSHGEKDGQFVNPNNLVIDQANGNMYICDQGNNRVQLYSSNLDFKYPLWQNLLRSPLDIKLTEHSIFVLDERNPCLHEFNYHYSPVRSTVNRGYLHQVVNPWGFCIDSDGNVYITDSTMGCVYVFAEHKDELIHQFGKFLTPQGICINKDGGIVIASSTTGGSIQIF